jgi:hypothetical protein
MFDSDSDADTDQEILANVAKPRNWDSFNVNTENKVITAKNDKTIPLNESQAIKERHAINESRIGELVSTLAKDLNILKEKAYKKLLNSNKLPYIKKKLNRGSSIDRPTISSSAKSNRKAKLNRSRSYIKRRCRSTETKTRKSAVNRCKKLDKSTNVVNSSMTPSSFRDNPYKNNIREI